MAPPFRSGPTSARRWQRARAPAEGLTVGRGPRREVLGGETRAQPGPSNPVEGCPTDANSRPPGDSRLDASTLTGVRRQARSRMLMSHTETNVSNRHHMHSTSPVARAAIHRTDALAAARRVRAPRRPGGPSARDPHLRAANNGLTRACAHAGSARHDRSSRPQCVDLCEIRPGQEGPSVRGAQRRSARFAKTMSL